MFEHLNDILENTTITPSTAAVKLLVSFFLGAIIGIERQFRRREAGMRTFTLICMGSAAAMLSGFSEWRSGPYCSTGTYRYRFPWCRGDHAKSWKYSRIDNGCLYLGSGRDRSGRGSGDVCTGIDRDRPYIGYPGQP